MRDDGSAPKRRREDYVATDLDTYVQDVITRLDRVILRLLDEAVVLRPSPRVADSDSVTQQAANNG